MKALIKTLRPSLPFMCRNTQAKSWLLTAETPRHTGAFNVSSQATKDNVADPTEFQNNFLCDLAPASW